jgi:hypothetical protein
MGKGDEGSGHGVILSVTAEWKIQGMKWKT